MTCSQLQFSASLIFSTLHFCFLALHQVQRLPQLQEWQTVLHFPLTYVIISMDTMTWNWAFYFLGSRLPLSFCRIWAGSLCNVHKTFQKPQAVALKLYWVLFVYLVRLFPYILIMVQLKLIYVFKVVQYLFPCRLACCIFHVANKHSLTVIPAYIPSHFNVEANYLMWGSLF